jgi:hypothetical protein
MHPFYMTQGLPLHTQLTHNPLPPNMATRLDFTPHPFPYPVTSTPTPHPRTATSRRCPSAMGAHCGGKLVWNC